MVRRESRPNTISHITLGTKQTGAPSAGNLHAGCDGRLWGESRNRSQLLYCLSLGRIVSDCQRQISQKFPARRLRSIVWDSEPTPIVVSPPHSGKSVIGVLFRRVAAFVDQHRSLKAHHFHAVLIHPTGENGHDSLRRPALRLALG